MRHLDAGIAIYGATLSGLGSILAAIQLPCKHDQTAMAAIASVNAEIAAKSVQNLRLTGTVVLHARTWAMHGTFSRTV